MRNLFKTPHGVRPSPDIRTRFVSSWTLPDNRMSGENPENRRSPKPRRRLVDPLLAAQLDDQSTGAHKPAEKVAAPQDSAVSTTVPSRQSARVTRNSRFHEHVDVAHVVEKAAPVDFGIEEGWGPQWRKPVQYGSGRRRALVNFDDLKRLNEDECLNDAIVDFYMIYLAQQSTSQAEKVYCFNTHFFTTLTQPVAGRKGLINYSRVARWTAKEDLFSYDYIVVPICESMHWYLAIICNMPSLVHRPSPELTEPTEPDPLSVPSPPKTEHHSTGNTPAHEQGPSGDVHMHGTNEMSAEAEEDNGINLFEEEQQLLAENPLDPTALDPARTVDGSLGGESGDYISIPEPDPDDTIPGSTKKEYKQLATKKNFKKIEPDTPIIIILDSLGNTHPRATRALKDYIIEEGKDKRNIETTITHNALYVKDSQIPMQENYTDCGVYLLGYLEKFFRDPTAFVTRILAREMNVHEDWPHMNALDLRRKLLRTLKGLYKEQNEERKEGKRAKRTPASKKEEDAKTETSPKLKSPIRMAQPTRQYLPSSSAPQSNGMSPRRKSPVVLIEHIPQSSNQLAENRIGAQEGRPQHDPPRLRSPARMDIKKGKRPLSVERTSRSSPTSLIKETPPRKQARTRASSESVKAIHSSPASGKDLMELADIVPPTPAVRGTSESVKPVRGSSAAPINIDDSIEMDVVMPRSRRRQLLDTAYEAKAVGYGTSSIEESLRDSEIQETPPPLGEEL
ncbi:cysteine proteinase [Sporormia fimetaria CBS 119925]|uniref:Cysteine proteinase n=1 Tax=Sporormia fimetaria CBS 119925 TaxID=1340428 RepID=A0A6A6UX65_9PLEO|nr:cysteine proteinase [Sporormia fimetaria CBS 119925]